MNNKSPVERLRETARIIEETSAQLASRPGGWPSVDRMEELGAHPDDAAWITLLGPGTGPVLAAWLRATADDEPEWSLRAPHNPEDPGRQALAFADLILRHQETE